MNKVYVGGVVMSGKNILWRLLDGHTKIISNISHNNIGSFVLREDCKNLFTKSIPKFKREGYKIVPTCQIAYKTGELATVPIGMFYYALFNFSQYSDLYSFAKGGKFVLHPKEGETEEFNFNFNIDIFESRLEKEIFFKENSRIFSENEIVDIVYQSYIEALEDKVLEKKTNTDFYFVDTLPNGILSFNMIQNKIPGAKIIIMKRNLESLAYANACRITGYKGHFDIDNKFKKVLYNQSKFVKKIKKFYIEVSNAKKHNENILLVDFDDLILRTEYSMKMISNFLGIDYEDVLSIVTANGVPLRHHKEQFTGKINDDPRHSLSEDEMNLLKYITNDSATFNISLLIKSLRWRVLHLLVLSGRFVLKPLLPRGTYALMRKLYRGL